MKNKVKLAITDYHSFDGSFTFGIEETLLVNNIRTLHSINLGDGGDTKLTILDENAYALFMEYINSLPRKIVHGAYGDPSIEPDNEVIARVMDKLKTESGIIHSGNYELFKNTKKEPLK